MAELEWFFRNGWYQLGVEASWPALGLASAWLLFAAVRRSFRPATPAGSRGIVASGLVLLWLALACLEALSATQLDVVASVNRYPYLLAFIVAGGGAGLVTVAFAIAAERLQAEASSQIVPRAVRACLAFAICTWSALWVWVLVQEMHRARG